MTTYGGRVAVVTGGNKGIGFEVARQLAQSGHTVLIGARDPVRGESAAAELRSAGLAVSFVLLEVGDPGGVGAAAELVESRYGRLDYS